MAKLLLLSIDELKKPKEVKISLFKREKRNEKIWRLAKVCYCLIGISIIESPSIYPSGHPTNKYLEQTPMVVTLNDLEFL